MGKSVCFIWYTGGEGLSGGLNSTLQSLAVKNNGAMDTPQHRNGPNSEFGSVSFFFKEFSEIPRKLKSVEKFQNILDWFPLYLHLTCFPFFGVRFFFFGSVSGFQKKF